MNLQNIICTYVEINYLQPPLIINVAMLVYEVFKKLISTWIYGFVVWDSDEVEDACTCFLWCCCKEFQCWERQKIMGSSYR